MNLFDYEMGKVVQSKASGNWGHIVSFCMVDYGEVVVKVLWDDGDTSPIHPNLIYVRTKENTNDC